MEEKIKMIQDYFVSKILNDEFEIVKMDEYACHIKIDERYKFKIWMANSAEHRQPYHAFGDYFIALNFDEQQALKCDEVLKERRITFTEKDLKQQKMAQYKKLQKELGLIESEMEVN